MVMVMVKCYECDRGNGEGERKKGEGRRRVGICYITRLMVFSVVKLIRKLCKCQQHLHLEFIVDSLIS